jgi:hypothetical protein
MGSGSTFTGINRPDCECDHSPRLRMCGAILPLPLYAFMALCLYTEPNLLSASSNFNLFCLTKCYFTNAKVNTNFILYYILRAFTICMYSSYIIIRVIKLIKLMIHITYGRHIKRSTKFWVENFKGKYHSGDLER